MRENPYLIRMDIEEDCNYSTYNATSGIYYRQFNWPVLGAMKDEFDCMQFDNGEAKPVGYHEHSFGTDRQTYGYGVFDDGFGIHRNCNLSAGWQRLPDTLPKRRQGALPGENQREKFLPVLFR